MLTEFVTKHKKNILQGKHFLKIRQKDQWLIHYLQSKSCYENRKMSPCPQLFLLQKKEQKNFLKIV